MELTPLGFKKPTSPDKGSSFFTHTYENWDLADELLTRDSEDHTGASFSASGVRYRKLITMPVTKTFNKTLIKVLEITSSPYVEIFPKIEKVSDTTFYIYLPVNTKNIRVIYV